MNENGIVEVISFTGCPNAEVVCRALDDARISYRVVVQNDLQKDDPKRELSSPSVIVKGKLVIGSRIQGGLGGCTWGGLSAEAIVDCVVRGL
jgi:hypothetical protein